MGFDHLGIEMVLWCENEYNRIITGYKKYQKIKID